MIEVLPDIYVVLANDRKGFGYSHFVRRTSGNVLLPRLKQTLLTDAYDEMEAAGGVSLVLISDRHFGGPGCRRCGAHFGAPLVASSVEARAIGTRCKVDIALPFEPQTIDGTDIEAIPTPGHTAGQMAYLIPVQGKRCLFAGDFAYRSGGAWRPGSKSRRAMMRGFAALEGVAFDYYVGCADYGEETSFVAATSIDELAQDILSACTRA